MSEGKLSVADEFDLLRSRLSKKRMEPREAAGSWKPKKIKEALKNEAGQSRQSVTR